MTNPYTVNFAPVTQTLQKLLKGIPRGAAELFLWIRRKSRPEKAVEFSLEDFCKDIGYSLDWASKMLKRLFDDKLITSERKGWKYWFRVVLHDPDFKLDDKFFTPSNPTSTPSNQESSPEKQPSNPCVTDSNLKEEKNIKDPEAEQQPEQALPEPEPIAIEPVAIASPRKAPAVKLKRTRGNSHPPSPGKNFYGEESPNVEEYEKESNGERDIEGAMVGAALVYAMNPHLKMKRKL